ncbi:hypothetical protein [Streptomyces sp. NBC_00233]|uniref:hypothetical protein n=1 Tax=Streptomyces sp. NBC_00233 TaxID=2975686 RepID=UPI00225C12EF|nr:hypothetical protein [Streptomyces sp. NBC_00233]MCX5233524.1 hypothetical protein [Streptomyces sp. NBC_00233]
MTTTTTMRFRRPNIGTQRKGEGETVPLPELEPIFTELAQRWESEGRLVPGREDEEWNLTARSHWPGR